MNRRLMLLTTLIAVIAAIGWQERGVIASWLHGSDRSTSAEQASRSDAAVTTEAKIAIADGGGRLGDALLAIARDLHVQVRVDPRIAQDAARKVDTSNPIDAITQLVEPYDTFYLHSEPKASESSDGSIALTMPATTLRAIWVYPRGAAQDVLLVNRAALSDQTVFEQRVLSPDANDRLEGYEGLLAQQSDQGGPTLARALSDSNDEVRAGALRAAINAGVPLSDDELLALAADRSPMIRQQAVEEAASRPEATELLSQLAESGDSEMQQQANTLLARLQGSKSEADAQQQVRGVPVNSP